MIAARDNATQDIAQLWFIIDQPQQRIALGALHADAKNVFCGRIEVDDQEAAVEKNYA
jgi:hypothetical protein